MCITCEHMLYEEHRAAEMQGKIKRCRKCKKFPANGNKRCYHSSVKAEVEREFPQTIQ